MIRCSAPLPEGSTNQVLARMIEPAPYQAPLGDDKGGNKEAESRPHSLFIQTGGISASKEDNQGEESEIPSPPKEGRGPPLKTWKQWFPNAGRNLRQRVLPRRVLLAHSARKGISPLPSCK